ncbi:beta-ketoacyl-ACP synthase [Bordetella genomosp. 13]|uniref:beta-ketoacyl-ACP synthase n=1 Tax=Bordetella genomosp. 13 TaxID=463040 RepID=UPI0011A7870E|nr:beta-ketoacyl-ACP synthase [Bordetella genomosp. 13]
MSAWLLTPGIVCALGAGMDQVGAAALRGDTGGMRAQAGWLRDRAITLGGVQAALPDLPGDLAAHHDSRNNRVLLAAALQIEATLRGAIARHGAARVAVVLGTSTSGVNDNAPAFRQRAGLGRMPDGYDYRRQRLSAPGAFLADWLGARGPVYALSTACTSSARALLSAKRLLDMDACDAVVCGGVDTLCRLTVNGFASLEAVSDGLCNPFSANRNGINIGEAGVLFLMQRERGPEDGVALLGGGASSDGWHMSAPDPSGAGARRAMQAALDDAGVTAEDIGWLNLHGTATQHNDAMESRAVADLFPHGVPCASTKSMTGHALGAAGALEAALCCAALASGNVEGRLPPHVWDGVADPELPTLDFSGAAHRLGARRMAMSNSFAFGGNNACLIFGDA